MNYTANVTIILQLIVIIIWNFFLVCCRVLTLASLITWLFEKALHNLLNQAKILQTGPKSSQDREMNKRRICSLSLKIRVETRKFRETEMRNRKFPQV